MISMAGIEPNTHSSEEPKAKLLLFPHYKDFHENVVPLYDSTDPNVNDIR